MNFCFSLIMHDVKVFDCSRYFTFKGSFSKEIVKVGFSEASAVKVNRGLLNIEGEKLLLSFNVVVISLILNKTKTNSKQKHPETNASKKEFLQDSWKIVKLKFKYLVSSVFWMDT